MNKSFSSCTAGKYWRSRNRGSGTREVNKIGIDVHEKVHEEVVVAMGVDELSVFRVVLHTRAHTAPHGFVRR